ncbi:MAG: hypothetical protein AB7T63_17120 [Planctomycetota bacterium]
MPVDTTLAFLPPGGFTVLAILLPVMFADLLQDKPRRVWLVLVGLALGLLAFDLARFDHGWGRELGVGALIIAPLLIIFGGSAWAVRRFYGWPDLGDGLPRAAFVSLFIAAGMLLGTRQHQADIAATQALADAKAFDVKVPAAELPATRLGWLAPPRLRRGTTTDGELVVAFPLAEGTGAAWRYRRAGSDAWATSASAPPVDRFEDGAP